MFQLTPVVKNLLIINVLMFVGTFILDSNSGWDRMSLALFYPFTDPSGFSFFKPYQLVTHFFMHGGFQHILFNMLGLAFLGPWVERVWGPKKFFIYYFLTAFGSAALHLVFKYVLIEQYGMFEQIAIPALGASGALYGILVAFAMLFPNEKLMLLFPPIPIKAKFLATGLILFDLFSGFSSAGSSGVAHFAHIGGAITGVLLILFWKSQGKMYG